MLRRVPVSELLPDEVAALGADTQADGAHLAFFGYGYVVGDTPTPSDAQHSVLMEQARRLGRMLTEEEVRSVVGPDGGEDAHG